MITDKYLYEVGEENEVVLVDVPVANMYHVEELGDNYFAPGEAWKKTNVEVGEGKFDGTKKEGDIFVTRLKNLELKPIPGEKSKLAKLLKKNRFVRNEVEGMNNELYSLLMTGAVCALERGNTAIVTNENPLHEAYLKLIENNSYLNRDNFPMYSFNENTSVEKIE